MNLFPDVPIRLQPYFGYRSREQLTISARALRSGKPGFEKGGRWQAIRTMLAQFASREVADLPVRLELKRPDDTNFTFDACTDKEGYVRFDVPLDGDWPLPDQPKWEVIELHWENVEGEQCVEGHVLVPGADTRLAVISDIDDTVIETGITGNVRAIARNWRRVVAQLPEDRLAVPGVDAFYGALGGGTILRNGENHLGDHVDATRRPFFYVSSSPWNLYSYLIAFMKLKKLPLGPLMLRDWGLNAETLGASSHGNHKRRAIDAILDLYTDMKFALIGDDTQGDLTAYADVVTAHPNRVAAVFIRTAGVEPMSPEEVAAKAMIQAAGVPLWLGNSYETGQAFLKAAGLQGEYEAERVVELVEQGAEGQEQTYGTNG